MNPTDIKQIALDYALRSQGPQDAEAIIARAGTYEKYLRGNVRDTPFTASVKPTPQNEFASGPGSLGAGVAPMTFRCVETGPGPGNGGGDDCPRWVVRTPLSIEHAELMEKVGYRYLAEHAPDQLTLLGRQRPPIEYQEAIERAIASERERCARIVDSRIGYLVSAELFRETSKAIREGKAKV
jgi:hypothetical protein